MTLIPSYSHFDTFAIAIYPENKSNSIYYLNDSYIMLLFCYNLYAFYKYDMIYIITQQYYVLDNRYYESKNLCSYEKKIYIYIRVIEC